MKYTTSIAKFENEQEFFKAIVIPFYFDDFGKAAEGSQEFAAWAADCFMHDGQPRTFENVGQYQRFTAFARDWYTDFTGVA